MFCDRRLKSRDILDTDEFLHRSAIFEYDDRRDTHDTELARSRRLSIDIMLHDGSFPFDFCCELFETRKHDLARSTPLSPEIHESHSGSDVFCEACISRNFDRHREGINNYK